MVQQEHEMRHLLQWLFPRGKFGLFFWSKSQLHRSCSIQLWLGLIPKVAAWSSERILPRQSFFFFSLLLGQTYTRVQAVAHRNTVSLPAYVGGLLTLFVSCYSAGCHRFQCRSDLSATKIPFYPLFFYLKSSYISDLRLILQLSC